MENRIGIIDEDLDDIIHSTDIHLIIRRKKMTLFLDMQEDVRVYKLKKMIEAILKVRPVDQQLFVVFKNNDYLDKYEELSDSTAVLLDYGLTSKAASVTHPAIIGLAVRQKDGSFESVEMTPYSDLVWPKLPDLSKLSEPEQLKHKHIESIQKC